jgi:hypothetical protein
MTALLLVRVEPRTPKAERSSPGYYMLLAPLSLPKMSYDAALYSAICRTARVRLLLGSLSSSRIVKWFVLATGIKSPGR